MYDKLYICLSIIIPRILMVLLVMYCSVQCTQLIFVYPVHICADVLENTVRCLFVISCTHNCSISFFLKIIQYTVQCTRCTVHFILFTTVYIFSVVFSRAGVEALIVQLHRIPKNEQVFKNQSINNSINQPTNQPTNQSVNQSTSQPFIHKFHQPTHYSTNQQTFFRQKRKF